MNISNDCFSRYIILLSYYSITDWHFVFFSIRLLQMSPSINEIGDLVWPVFWANVICWIIVYLCICNGVKSVGKVSLKTGLSTFWRLAVVSITLEIPLNCDVYIIYFQFADRVFYSSLPVRCAVYFIYTRRDAARRLEGDFILYLARLGTISET